MVVCFSSHAISIVALIFIIFLHPVTCSPQGGLIVAAVSQVDTLMSQTLMSSLQILKCWSACGS